MLTKMFVTNPSDPVSITINSSNCFYCRLSSCKPICATTTAIDPPSMSTRGWNWTSCVIKSKSLAVSCLKALMRTQPLTRRPQILTQTDPQMAARVKMMMCSTFLSRRSRGIMPLASLEPLSVLKHSANGTRKRSSRRPFIQRAKSLSLP